MWREPCRLAAEGADQKPAPSQQAHALRLSSQRGWLLGAGQGTFTPRTACSQCETKCFSADFCTPSHPPISQRTSHTHNHMFFFPVLFPLLHPYLLPKLQGASRVLLQEDSAGCPVLTFYLNIYLETLPHNASGALYQPVVRPWE